MFINQRFSINSKQSILWIDSSVYLVDANGIEEFIQWELLKKFHFLTCFFFKVDLYDEDYDQIKIVKLLKEFIVWIWVTNILYKVYIKIKEVSLYLVKINEEIKKTTKNNQGISKKLH